MQNMKYLIVLVVILLTDQVHAARLISQEECRRLLHVDAEPNSYFVNQGCLVKCLVHGSWGNALEENGRTCPGNPSGKCYRGNCRSNVIPQLGHIDVWFDRGEFPILATYYVVACIRNSSESGYHPIRNVNHDSAVHCESNAIKSRNPVWMQVCANSDLNLFTDYSLVAFDVWNSIISGKKQFVGGGDLLISDLSLYGRASIPVELSHGQTIFVKVSFTVPSGVPCPQLSYVLFTMATLIYHVNMFYVDFF